MNNVLRIVRRDLTRLVKAPAALVVVLALCAFPFLYTWYNVAGFWDPYGNTGNLRVCVVNQDAGGASELTGYLDVGSSIVASLSSNDQLAWYFADEDQALDDLRRGECYAAFVIPADFTQNLLTITTGDFTQPEIEYYVNEKISAVSPKITDAGSTTLEETINSTFVSTVCETALDALEAVLGEANCTIDANSSEAADELAQAIAKLNGMCVSLDELSTKAQDLKVQVAKAQSTISASKPDTARALSKLKDLSAGIATLQDTCRSLQNDSIEQTAKIQAALEYIEQQGAGQGISEAAAAAQSLLAAYASTLSSTCSHIDGELADLRSAIASLETSVTGIGLLTDQAQMTLKQLGTTLDTAGQAAASTSELISDVADDLGKLRTDVVLLSRSAEFSTLSELTGLSNQEIADFMGSPTRVATERLYPAEAYGVAMAPLFMNLTFWIGAFMLIVIIRQEVDDEHIKNLTVSQRYMGRFLLLAIIVALQAIICCAGIMLMGIHPANAPALFIASIVAGLAYLSIIFALSVTMQHIGKALCIVLVFAQIPGASGIYPVEMTTPFFQAIYPFLPFAYGIDAMREALCGFYGHTYLHAIGVLLLFFAGALLFGLVVRPRISNINRMFADQVSQSGIFKGEDIEIPARKLKVTALLDALSDKDEYRSKLARRYARFSHWYPRIIRGSIVFAIAASMLVFAALTLSNGGKVILLTIWLILLVALCITLIAVECIRLDLEHRLTLDDTSAQNIIELYKARKSLSNELDPKGIPRIELHAGKHFAGKHQADKRHIGKHQGGGRNDA